MTEHQKERVEVCTCGHEINDHEHEDGPWIYCEVEGCDCTDWDPIGGATPQDPDEEPEGKRRGAPWPEQVTLYRKFGYYGRRDSCGPPTTSLASVRNDEYEYATYFAASHPAVLSPRECRLLAMAMWQLEESTDRLERAEILRRLADYAKGTQP